MGIIDSLMGSAYDAILPSVVVPLFRKYAGPGCRDLRRAIQCDADIYKLWVANAVEEKKKIPSMWTPDDLRSLASKFPQAKEHITAERVRKWLHDHGCQDILWTIDSTPGGRTWLERQVEAFKEGLF